MLCWHAPAPSSWLAYLWLFSLEGGRDEQVLLLVLVCVQHAASSRLMAIGTPSCIADREGVQETCITRGAGGAWRHQQPG
jgi:hypothetical protein